MPKRTPLKIEIIGMFIVKIALLYGLWFLCFSHPTDKTLKPTDMAIHLFQSAAVAGHHQ